MRAQAIQEELAAVLTAFELATGFQVCFRPMSRRWEEAGLELGTWAFSVHRSGFCEEVKARALAACMKCDLTDLPAACSRPEGRVAEPFVRTCHAGADEVLLPLWSQGMLVAVLFVGQFTRGVGTGWARADLRQISDSDVQQLRTLMLPLRSYLIDVLAELERQHRHHQTGRRGLIEEYIQESLSAGPRLAELASRLSLSQSRTSHVIRELTGRPFQELVAEYRISVARDLLAETNGTVAWIARQTGFKDSGYFCRYFKHKTGTSPMGFRGQFRRVVQV